MTTFASATWHCSHNGSGRYSTTPNLRSAANGGEADAGQRVSVSNRSTDAAAIGPATAALCELILEHRPHPEQGFRACLGIVRLVKPFGMARVEAAATRALDIGAMTYGSVRSILDNNLNRHSAGQRGPDGVTILHPDIRSPRHYH